MVFLFSFSCSQKPKFKYPKLEISNKIEKYHDIEVIDPYRNLENLNDSVTIDWFRKNAELSDSVLNNDINNHDFFFKKIKSYEESTEPPIYLSKPLTNGCYLYFKKIDDNNNGIFYRNKSNVEKLLFNSKDVRKNSRVTYFKESWDFKKIAICIAKQGEDESEIVIFDIEKNKLLPDVIKKVAVAVAGTIEWLPDNSGFIYVELPHFRYNDPTYLQNSKARLHKLGNVNSKSKIILSKDKNLNLKFSSGDIPRIQIPDSNSAHVYSWGGNVSKYHATYIADTKELESDTAEWRLLFSKDEQIPQFFTNDNWLYYRTSKNTPNFKINRVSLDELNFNKVEVLVPEFKNEVIVDFTVLYDEIYLTTLKNGVEAKLYSYNEFSSLTEIKLPLPSGSCSLQKSGDNILVDLEGWTQPSTLFSYNPKTKTFENKSLQKKSGNRFNNLTVQEVEVKSHDGIMVPLSLIHNENIKKNKKNRTILLSYGSYGAVTSAVYSELLLSWLEKGDILAIPHVRGGGEKGDDWYKGGFKSTKSNTWKDFIACTEYLIDQGYTSPDYTIAFGNSAGGIPAGRSITDRPDLYAAAIMTAPALNMVRCEFQPNGQTNIPEFGTVKDSIEFKALLEMDSYHHLNKNEEYPAVLIQIGMNDGIVTPWDPGKFIARLQNNTNTKNPALLDVKFEGNHSGGGTMDETYKGFSRLYAFALWQTKHVEFQPKD